MNEPDCTFRLDIPETIYFWDVLFYLVQLVAGIHYQVQFNKLLVSSNYLENFRPVEHHLMIRLLKTLDYDADRASR